MMRTVQIGNLSPPRRVELHSDEPTHAMRFPLLYPIPPFYRIDAINAEHPRLLPRICVSWRFGYLSHRDCHFLSLLFIFLVSYIPSSKDRMYRNECEIFRSRSVSRPLGPPRARDACERRKGDAVHARAW